MMPLYKIMVQNESTMELGAFLLKNGFSKQAINNAKNRGGMLIVNHKARYTNYRLHRGDEVIFVSGSELSNPWLKPSYERLEIVKETSNYLIIDKPAGLLSIPSRFDDNAVVNRVLGYFEQHQMSSLKPHVITRLDRDTTGLVLVGKNAIAHGRFSKLNKQDFIKKYHAIVHGNFAKNELTGVIEAPIGRKNKEVKRSIDFVHGKKAVTVYRVLEQVPQASLVELRLYTGRTHQIRLHMQSIGHPLFGDPLYGINDQFDRQALNCCFLSFPDPFVKGKLVKVKASLAKDMLKLWRQLSLNDFTVK
ncbi:RluA family pseudouridine synthase [Lactobacillus sp. ESL0228]|uniref:RluA family pseudouridine synthase n=1 Tax=Lactobacillus sp. ESL0228 TaxID=2069352 RepID=UPI000EFAD303|nr:RluA family pseudouridine synthase [Lactobacillus sp. ESL0228]RMC49650.1 RluA family pseudouridine synthase [Lactobacillus sp. ESL0228]